MLREIRAYLLRQPPVRSTAPQEVELAEAQDSAVAPGRWSQGAWHPPCKAARVTRDEPQGVGRGLARGRPQQRVRGDPLSL